MINRLSIFTSFLILSLLMGYISYAEPGQESYADNSQLSPVKTPKVKLYRTFLQIQRYTIENNGDIKNPISNVRLEIAFKEKPIIHLPGGGQYWPIGNGQVQEINQTFEIPWEFINNDGFTFNTQIVRKGIKILPCKFDVTQISQFNRSYVCKLDIDWQEKKQIPKEKLDKEALQIRIFTDLNSPKKEIPQDAIALK